MHEELAKDPHRVPALVVFVPRAPRGVKGKGDTRRLFGNISSNPFCWLYNDYGLFSIFSMHN